MPSVDQLISWIIVGLIGGSLAGLVTALDRKGFGLVRNLPVGLAGALIGGLLFHMLGLFPALDKIPIPLRSGFRLSITWDVVAALIGSLIALVVLRLWQRSQKSP
jgi:uncharacterized membrane protein YeaQ/YmgE (transglycosylase-associated protein family)